MPDDSGSGAAMVSELSVPCTKCVYPSARPRRRLAALSPPHEIAARLSRGPRPSSALGALLVLYSSALRSIRLDPRIRAKNFVHGTLAATGPIRCGCG